MAAAITPQHSPAAARARKNQASNPQSSPPESAQFPAKRKSSKSTGSGAEVVSSAEV